MINPRLFDQYGIDTTKDLGIRQVCPRPFDTILVDKQGSCYACECTSWLPQSVGNLQVQGLDDILNSRMRGQMQESVVDGTYRYCNEHQCTYIREASVLDGKTKHIKNLRLAIDDSCNLRCPSCRKSLIFHKNGASFRLGVRLADKINEWLHKYPHNIQVHIGSDGDPFASHVNRHFMEQTPRRDNIKYSVLTNGLLFKEFSDRVPHVINNLNELGVSIDGASEHTYERLRLGGKWDKVLENLQCMADVKQKNDFRFVMHFVVQKDNWHEMSMMLSLAKDHCVDKVYFNMIQDWNTGLDFKQQDFQRDVAYREILGEVSADPLSHTDALL